MKTMNHYCLLSNYIKANFQKLHTLKLIIYNIPEYIHLKCRVKIRLQKSSIKSQVPLNENLLSQNVYVN